MFAAVLLISQKYCKDVVPRTMADLYDKLWFVEGSATLSKVITKEPPAVVAAPGNIKPHP